MGENERQQQLERLPGLEFVFYFVSAWVIASLFQRFSGNAFLGEYPFAASTVLVALVALSMSAQAENSHQALLRAAVPLGCLLLFYQQSSVGEGFVERLQSKVGVPHFLFSFAATFFTFIYTQSSVGKSSLRSKAQGTLARDAQSSGVRQHVPAGKPQFVSSPPLAAPTKDPFEDLIGQEQVVKPLQELAKVVRSGIRVGKRNAPHAVLFFLGPTGVGKTEAARALALAIYGREDALIRFDMGQFTEAHQANRFYGPPPGYVGYEEGGQLTRAVQKKPRSVVLLDEVEKAHAQIWDAFLPVFDEGYIVDGSSNQKVDMTNTVIVLTSNLLAGNTTLTNASPAQLKEALLQTGQFRPELIGRINEIFVFKALETDVIAEILRRRLDAALWSLSEQGISVNVEEESIRGLIAEVKQAQFGVRQIDDVVRKFIRQLLAEREKDATPED